MNPDIENINLMIYALNRKIEDNEKRLREIEFDNSRIEDNFVLLSREVEKEINSIKHFHKQKEHYESVSNKVDQEIIDNSIDKFILDTNDNLKNLESLLKNMRQK